MKKTKRAIEQQKPLQCDAFVKRERGKYHQEIVQTLPSVSLSHPTNYGLFCFQKTETKYSCLKKVEDAHKRKEKEKCVRHSVSVRKVM